MCQLWKEIATTHWQRSNAGMETANLAPAESTANHRRLPRPLWIFLLTVALAVVFVGLRFGIPLYRQAVAALKIEQFGGVVTKEPMGPNWLRGIVGEQRIAALDKVTAVVLWHLDLENADFECLKWLPNLKELTIEGTQIPDAGLENLKGLAELRILSLANTSITDAGLKRLKGSAKIRELNLEGTKITDAGLEHIKSLTGLEILSLRNTQITDAGLKHFRGISNLRSIDLLYATKTTWRAISDLLRVQPQLEINGRSIRDVDL